MATQADVRQIALALPGVVEASEKFAFSVLNKGKEKGFVWVWKERIDPKKARVPNHEVLAVCVRNMEIREMLLASDERKFFTEPHYNGFPAVLVRLAEIGFDELAELIEAAWRCKTPKELLQ